MSKCRLLITAGPTREYLDSVRFLSNASSGRMGYALAAEAAARGHDVVLVSGPVEMAGPAGVELVRVVSAAEMFEASVRAFEGCAAALMAAAVCDYRPVARRDRKLPKSPRSFTLELEPTADICAHLGATKAGRVVVGFAMEDHDHRAHAEQKLRRKGCDAIILNDVANAGGDGGTIEILRATGGWSGPHTGTKAELAKRIVDLVESLAAETEPRPSGSG